MTANLFSIVLDAGKRGIATRTWPILRYDKDDDAYLVESPVGCFWTMDTKVVMDGWIVDQDYFVEILRPAVESFGTAQRGGAVDMTPIFTMLTDMEAELAHD
ncbi:hypothetical protein [Ralstonia insidiosa]|uniref:Uncharacterized protein n=1 Tax=Ralstonia insidiosa TaxID=190721 RepID=A0A848NXB1_9RALS|nr:hypothetical protein [Ralstonia insidiosa]NMV37887.1 hypothetical protein [Ralstonia insidiosa]